MSMPDACLSTASGSGPAGPNCPPANAGHGACLRGDAATTGGVPATGQEPCGAAPDAAPRPLVALRLTVNNHPGVMSHVCGLFARRAFNVEAILCTPVNGGTVSRIWLLVAEDERLEQMVRQVRKLHDVLDVRRRPAGGEGFARLAQCMAEWERETAG